MTDTEKKIAEIREALRRVELGTYHITAFANLEYWLRFLLSELDRAEKELELFDQRGETIERQLNIIEQLQEENQKLREERDDLSFREREAYGAFKYWFGAWQEAKKENEQLQEKLQSAQQEINRLEQERDKLIEGLRWYAQRNDVNTVSLMLSDKGQRARDTLKDIGVTVE